MAMIRTRETGTQMTTLEVENVLRKNNGEAVLPVAKVTVANPINTSLKAKVYVLFDSGNQRSFMTSGLAKRLELSMTGQEKLSIHTFAAQDSMRCILPKVELIMELQNGVSKKLFLNVFTEMTCKLGTRYQDDTGYTSSAQSVAPDILVGTDYYWELIDLSLKQTNDAFFVVPTKLGDVITGEQTTGDSYSVTTNNVSCYITTTVENFWYLETLGIEDSPNVNDDDEALKQFYKTLKFENNRYLAYKNVDLPVSDNYSLCYFRLKNVVNCLVKENPSEKYDDIIKDQMSKGIIEEIKENTSAKNVSYLPQHPVITPGKQTTKIRVVYDASAKSGTDKLSLNESFYRGPIMLP